MKFKCCSTVGFSRSNRRCHVWFACLLALGVAGTASGLMMENIGPLGKERLHPQMGWPDGLLDVMGHPSRVYSRDVNGSETVYFKADFGQTAEMIDLFSKMRCRDLVVRLHTSMPPAVAMKGGVFAHNIRLDFTGGIGLGMKRIEAKEASTFDPVLNILVDEESLDFMEACDWPANLIIVNDVPDLDVQGKRKRPARELWHTKVDFEDGKPAVDFESGLQTTITLWEKDHPIGMNIGRVTYKGTFAAPFSKNEIERLKSGELWMTMTVGNWLQKAKPTDPRLAIDAFAMDPDSAKKSVVTKPALYYGQLLFDDGTPAVLDPAPWPGAELQVSFSFAGMVRPDKNGKFKVSFTKKQLEKLKGKREGKNIYVPSYTEKNQSTALHTFPVGKLSMDEARPGVVKIPKPVTNKKDDGGEAKDDEPKGS